MFLWGGGFNCSAVISVTGTVLRSNFILKGNFHKKLIFTIFTMHVYLSMHFYYFLWKFPPCTFIWSCTFIIFIINFHPARLIGYARLLGILEYYVYHIVQSSNLYTTKLTVTFTACCMSILLISMPTYSKTWKLTQDFVPNPRFSP